MQPYIRKLRCRAIVQPNIEKAWEVGDTLGVLTGDNWICGPLFLFVCGYYGHVSALMILAAERIRDTDLLARMARALPKLAGAQPPPLTAAKIKGQLLLNGFSEIIAQKTARRFGDIEDGALSDEKHLWSLDPYSYATFEEVWQSLRFRGLPMNDPTVATCELITEGATYQIADRDRIVSGLIADALLAKAAEAHNP